MFLRKLDRGENDVKGSLEEKNAIRVYAAELICSTGVLGFQTFKLTLCLYNKLRSYAEILS